MIGFEASGRCTHGALVRLPQTCFVCFSTSLRRTPGLCAMLLQVRRFFTTNFKPYVGFKYSDFAFIHLVLSG